MTSLVSDFIINPVIRQARRLSRSSAASAPIHSAQHRRSADSRLSQDATLSETEEDDITRDGAYDSASPAPSSRSSVAPTTPGETSTDPHECDTIQQFDEQETGPPPNEDTMEARRYHDVPLEEPAATATSSDDPAVSDNSSTQLAESPSLDLSPRKALPEDDGMGPLRKRIVAIQAQDVPGPEKARLLHDLLMEGYTKFQTKTEIHRPITPISPTSWEQRIAQGPLEAFKFWQNALSLSEKFILSGDDAKPTFARAKRPEEPGYEDDDIDEESDERPLGCDHYRRNVKLQCSTCNRWYTCRFCHDKAEDHTLIRKDTKHMLCMFCGTAQRAGEVCAACGETAARYYCNICKLWDDDPSKSIYHCADCGICRIGRGLGKDFFHCKKCCACIAISKEHDHKCIERATDCDCPICSEYMFNSPKAVVFMRCGHSIHRDCLKEFSKTSYKCPICSQSIENMETQFRNLDIAIQQQPMPPQFQDTRANIFCNDCRAKTSVRYHWLGLKCGNCHSYNTAQLQILGPTLAAESTGAPTSVQTIESVETTHEVAPPVSDATAAREIPIRRRRHSSDAMSFLPIPQNISIRGFSIFNLSDRLSRSVSPLPAATFPSLPGFASSRGDLAEEEEGDGLIGFWRRMPRRITSNEEENDDVNLEGESDSSDSEDMGDDDDYEEEEDDDDDPMSLLGHR